MHWLSLCLTIGGMFPTGIKVGVVLYFNGQVQLDARIRDRIQGRPTQVGTVPDKGIAHIVVAKEICQTLAHTFPHVIGVFDEGVLCVLVECVGLELVNVAEETGFFQDG